MKSYKKSGAQVDYTNTGAAIASDDTVVIGQLTGVAVNDIAVDDTGPVQVAGVVQRTKLTGTPDVFSEGDPVYKTAGADTFQRTRTATFAGLAARPAAEAATRILVNLNVGAAPGLERAITDPGDAAAIPVIDSGTCQLTTGAGGETRTLADPEVEGQEIALALATDGGGDAVVATASAVNLTGNNRLTLGDAGDAIVLRAISIAGSLAWRVMFNDGVALSTV